MKRRTTDTLPASADLPDWEANLRLCDPYARWVARESGSTPETGRYTDTLDYAIYGIDQSLLVLSQRAALDLLDKIAVTTTEYLDLGDKARSVYFRTRWHEQGKRPEQRDWQPAIRDEIERGATSLVALAELAEDIDVGGSLSSRRETRHAGTHRLVVLHDQGCRPSRPSRYILHQEESQFVETVIESLRTARAAILYFVAFVNRREARNHREAKGPLGTMYAPPHEWVRDEDT